VTSCRRLSGTSGDRCGTPVGTTRTFDSLSTNHNWRWPWFGGALEIGLRRALHVREERLSTRYDAYRLLYVSDIHLRKGRSDALCGQVLDSVTWCKPDVVLLGGDLVDRRSELIKLSELVRKIQDVARVLAIGGNHDRRIGINRVRAAVVRWRRAMDRR
jgi:predicted MPP superfamily phosphohydrolase